MNEVQKIESMQQLYECGIFDGIDALGHAIKEKMQKNTKGKRMIVLYEAELKQIIEKAKEGTK